MEVMQFRIKTPLLALGLYLLAFALPACSASLSASAMLGWECAWFVLSEWGGGNIFLYVFLNLANFGMLFGWWSWRINSIRRATVSFTVASISAVYWSAPSLVTWNLSELSSLKVGYWAWLMSIVFSAGLAFYKLRAASKRSST